MRRKLSSLIALLIALTILICSPALALTPEDYDAENPQQLTSDMLASEAAIVMDASSGDVLFGKNEYTRMHPASTTKIMTLLLGIESGFDLDATISIPQAAADIAADSTIIPVYPGDTMTFRDLLIGFFLNSGNDGANAVAVLVSGSLENFVDLMNRRAQEIGCRDTHFANAHGYTDEEHYTTAYDMALITRTAMQNATFREIASVGLTSIIIDGRGEVQVGSRRLILQEGSPYYYPDCIGVKTGTTSAAGNCFVGAAERDGAMLISVAFKAPEDTQRWTDTIRLFDYGWTRYDTYTIEEMYQIASPQIVNIMISNAAQDDPFEGRLDLEMAQVSNANYLRMVERDNDNALNEAVADFVSRCTVQVPHDLTAPISRGEIIGDFSYFDPATASTITAKLISARDVEERTVLATLADYLPFLRIFENRLFLILLLVLVVLLVLIVALVLYRRAEKQRRRRRIYERRRAAYLHREAQRQAEEYKRRIAAQARERGAKHTSREASDFASRRGEGSSTGQPPRKPRR